MQNDLHFRGENETKVTVYFTGLSYLFGWVYIYWAFYLLGLILLMRIIYLPGYLLWASCSKGKKSWGSQRKSEKLKDLSVEIPH